MIEPLVLPLAKGGCGDSIVPAQAIEPFAIVPAGLPQKFVTRSSSLDHGSDKLG
ncbi:hypothetical protein H6F67_21675 [Microcoleus sp. FACHB-1515]|uniref:hypothetical protein n=1 Tax=Cyanophyceae TaxID=3028117 RepID=UPI0016847612|nr:hypothetical protein [Microcoleus sp. FACHB-1515]MBD2092461.1 hypothetical protein [Microcoleus sp. FACHB-1515]